MTSGSRSSSTGDDALRLPAAPGVLRRFWARHPTLADIVIAGICLLMSLVPAATFSESSRRSEGIAAAWPVTGPVVASLVVIGCFTLLIRRRRPLVVFIAAAVVGVTYLLSPAPLGGPLLLVATYSLAVYRSTRACVIAVAVALSGLGAVAAFLGFSGAVSAMVAWNVIVGETIMALIGGLIGANVGNRKRYVEALIERSRQLAVERDQQAALAAATERDRIARELHDIVAHSLTVMVALAEGVAASADVERSRPGAVAIATTGREALRDMRETLGVLRSPDAAPLAPLVRDTTADTVASARAAGFETHLTVTGDASSTSNGVLLAVSRIVQEAVTNAMRHADGASRIDVSISHARDGVSVSVTDDGVAVPGVGDSGGYGLRGVRERVELAGGTVTAGPRQGRGWAVHARLPQNEEDA